MKLHPRVSRSLVERIKRFEGFRRRSARLPSGGWTIGYGHVRTAREGVSVSAEDAEALLYYDLSEVAEKVEAWTFAPLNQNQFEALTAFAFNIGVENFRVSSALKRLNEGQPLLAAEALELWRRAEIGGEDLVVDALVRRRALEKALFLTPPEGFRPSPTPVLAPLLDRQALAGAGRAEEPIAEERILEGQEPGESAADGSLPPSSSAPSGPRPSSTAPPAGVCGPAAEVKPQDDPPSAVEAVVSAGGTAAKDAAPVAGGDDLVSALGRDAATWDAASAAVLQPTSLFKAANDMAGGARLEEPLAQIEAVPPSPRSEDLAADAPRLFLPPPLPAPIISSPPTEEELHGASDQAFADRVLADRIPSGQPRAEHPPAAAAGSRPAGAARRSRTAHARTAVLFLIAGVVGFVLVVLASVSVTTGQASAASLATGVLGVVGLTIGFGGFMLRSRTPV